MRTLDKKTRAVCLGGALTAGRLQERRQREPVEAMKAQARSHQVLELLLEEKLLCSHEKCPGQRAECDPEPTNIPREGKGLGFPRERRETRCLSQAAAHVVSACALGRPSADLPSCGCQSQKLPIVKARLLF